MSLFGLAALILALGVAFYFERQRENKEKLITEPIVGNWKLSLPVDREIGLPEKTHSMVPEAKPFHFTH